MRRQLVYRPVPERLGPAAPRPRLGEPLLLDPLGEPAHMAVAVDAVAHHVEGAEVADAVEGARGDAGDGVGEQVEGLQVDEAAQHAAVHLRD